MRYPQELQEKCIEESLTLSLPEISKLNNVPERLIKKWLLLSMPDEKLKYTVRQKFYNYLPLIEAKITTAYSDFVVCSITDDEWEELSKTVSKAIFDLAFTVYKASLLEERTYENISGTTKKEIDKKQEDEHFQQLNLQF